MARKETGRGLGVSRKDTVSCEARYVELYYTFLKMYSHMWIAMRRIMSL